MVFTALIRLALLAVGQTGLQSCRTEHACTKLSQLLKEGAQEQERRGRDGHFRPYTFYKSVAYSCSGGCCSSAKTLQTAGTMQYMTKGGTESWAKSSAGTGVAPRGSAGTSSTSTSASTWTQPSLQNLFNRLREAGSAAELDKVAERQPFYLEAVSELLRLAGDPDWRRYTTSTWSFLKGVPLGVDVRLPRRPALFPRKCKHRIYPEADHVFDGELRDNYSSARESAEQIERQFQQEIELGAMVRYDLDQARAEFGDELVVASLGAVPKADQSVRDVHDATHGLHVNDRIRVRDAQTYPTGADLRVALEQLPGISPPELTDWSRCVARIGPGRHAEQQPPP